MGMGGVNGEDILMFGMAKLLGWYRGGWEL